MVNETTQEFDLGPLSWVQGEIDQAIGRGLDALVERNGGDVDKFLGDGIMALFGVTPSRGAGSRDALLAARDMLRALGRLNEEFAPTLPGPLHMGLGIHMGPAVCLRGTTEVLDYYRVLLAELRQRIADGVPAVDGERLRLYWEGMPVWGRLRQHSECRRRLVRENQPRRQQQRPRDRHPLLHAARQL